jgi:hypothetical protein
MQPQGSHLDFMLPSFTVLELNLLPSFFILGARDVDAKLNAILKPIRRLPIDSTTLQEFKTIFKYLAFVASAAKAPVR